MPKPRLISNQIRLSPALFKAVESYQEKEGIATLSQAVRELLYIGLDALNDKPILEQINASTEQPNHLISRDEAAKILNIHKCTLYQWRRINKLKYEEHFVRVQNQILYFKEALEVLAQSDNDAAIANKRAKKKVR